MLYSNEYRRHLAPQKKGTATVHRRNVGNYRAECSCGWTAPRRWLKAAACQDAWIHAAQEGCEVSYPLVVH